MLKVDVPEYSENWPPYRTPLVYSPAQISRKTADRFLCYEGSKLGDFDERSEEKSIRELLNLDLEN